MPRVMIRLAVLIMIGLFAPLSSARADGSNGLLCASYSGLPEEEGPQAGMVWIRGGTFTMGDAQEWPEERPTHQVTVSGFWIDRHEVTNAQFARFVAATGYRTMAEQGVDATKRPDLPPELLVPGSMVFDAKGETGPAWLYRPGASWRHPSGPGNSIEGLDNRPVVQVAYEDALAYARWLGRDLPTEAEWEFAARGGLDGATYAWGDDYYDPALGWRVNSWQGSFPGHDEGLDGFHGLAPVGCYPPNGYGLLDMTGNVWELARDWYVPGHPSTAQHDPTGPDLALAARFAGPEGPPVVTKGGSWLCAPTFCARYRPSARQPHELGLGTNHVGFRTVLRDGER
jgi:formylglycine-generating enzyme required for sulfatase activity